MAAAGQQGGTSKTVGAGLKTAFYQGDPKDGKVLSVAGASHG